MKIYLRHIALLITALFSIALNAQTIIESKLGSCDANAEIELVQSRIVSKEVRGNQLKLAIGFVENCCYSPDFNSTLRNDTLFLTESKTIEKVCTCLCCFELELTFEGIRDTNFVLLVDGKTFQTRPKYMKLPHEYAFDKKTPLNQTDVNGSKIGLWREKYPNSKKVKYEIYYVPDEDGTYESWIKSFDIKGNLISVLLNQSRYSGITLDADQYESFVRNL